MKLTISPIAVPRASSEIIQIAMSPIPVLVAFTVGQREKRASVLASAMAIRATPGPASCEGSGMKTNTPAMRERTSTKPRRVDADRVRSLCITGQIAEDGGRVCHSAMEHPGHQQKESPQAGEKARHSA